MSRKNHAVPLAAAAAEAVAPEVAEAERPHAVVEVAAPAKTRIRAIFGTMIHPFKPMDIRHDTISEVDEIDSWLQSQIDAKKIEVV